MNKTLITLLLITIAPIIKAQEITIDDLQKTVISQTIDKADSILRLKGYMLTDLPKQGDKDTTYRFEKGGNSGNLEVVSVYKNLDEHGTFIVSIMCDGESKFYRLKEECSKLREIQKIDEFSPSSGSFVRRYHDRFFDYAFQMITTNDSNVDKINYSVFIRFNYHSRK